jgi:membrane protease YdiL (CAAX protease family)
MRLPEAANIVSASDESRPRRLPPSPISAILLLSLGVAVALLFAVGGQLARLPQGTSLLVGSLAGSASALVLALLTGGTPGRPIWPAESPPRGALLSLVALLAGAVIVTSEIQNVVQALWPPSAAFLDSMRQVLIPAEALEKAIALPLAGLLVPVVEEILFRGVIQNGFVSRFGPAAGIGLSSLLFAVYHLNPWQAFSALALGALFGWVTHRAGSLRPAITLHAGNNTLAVLLVWVAPDLPGLTSGMLEPEVHHLPAPLLLAGAAVAAWGGWRFADLHPAGGPRSPCRRGGAP